MPVKQKRQKPLGDVTAYFVEAARRLPQVQRILLADFPGEQRKIWVVIDEPHGEPDFGRIAVRPIHDVFGEAIDHGTELVDFRVVNLQNINIPIDSILPHGARVLFERKSVP